MIDGNDIIAYLVGPGRATMLEHYTPRSCILSTAVGLEVFRYFDIEARPVGVTVQIVNQALREMVEAGVTDPNEVARRRAKVLEVEGSNRLDYEKGEWDGHLVIVVRDSTGQEVLVDLAADQFDRPAYRIKGEPKVAPWSPEGVSFTEGIDGSTWVYRPMPQGGGFRRSRDWKWEGRWRPVAGRIIRDIKETLA